MTLFDLFAGLVLLVSAGVGFIRGAVREMVTVVAFLLAAVGSLLALRVTGPMAREVIDPDWAGTAAAVLVLFAALYILLRVIGASLTERIRGGPLSSIDRAIGLGFGLIRALVVLGVFNLLFTAATPESRIPRWIEGAALYPLTEASANVLRQFAPQGGLLASRIGPALERAVREGEEPTKGPGYEADDRSQVDDLVEKSR